MDWWIGLLGSATISGIAYWKKSLTAGGGLAAVIVGTIVFALGSPAWYGSLIAFFISSTLWARWRQEEKRGAERKVCENRQSRRRTSVCQRRCCAARLHAPFVDSASGCLDVFPRVASCGQRRYVGDGARQLEPR